MAVVLQKKVKEFTANNDNEAHAMPGLKRHEMRRRRNEMHLRGNEWHDELSLP
ncbi:hypothetical protein KXR87_20420 [Yokenella regensburgei]|uniref:hypothetical protein n=1 Tax=Yokenella regensburgei TaxID=158877 RepID=UPI003F1488C8